MENIKIVREYKNTKVEVNAQVDFYTHYNNDKEFNCYKLFENGKEIRNGNYTDKEKLLKELNYEDCTGCIYVNGEEIKIGEYVLDFTHNRSTYLKVKDNYIDDFVKFCEKIQKEWYCFNYVAEYAHYNKWGVK